MQKDTITFTFATELVQRPRMGRRCGIRQVPTVRAGIHTGREVEGTSVAARHRSAAL